MEKAIKLSIEGGYEGNHPHKLKHVNKYWAVWIDGNGNDYTVAVQVYMLDPLFWQALGKACGWYPYPNMRSEDYPGVTIGEWKEHNWHHYWHKLIDHIAKGKDADSFFNELLK